VRPLTHELRAIVGAAAVPVVLLWMVEVVNLVVGGGLDRFGIRPRETDGLAGIIWAPFIHVNVAHLVANSGPLFVLSVLVLLRGVRVFVLVSVFVMLVGGFALWLIGRPNSVQIGASGVVFGYLGYLLVRGVVERGLGAVVVALVVLALYGTALWGLLPAQPGVSFEGHITGFLSGGAGAWLGNSANRDRPLRQASAPGSGAGRRP
jgi:membrane associated rhomboid family serine protease